MFKNMFGKGKKSEEVAEVVQDPAIAISLEKSIISLDKTLISLEKKSGVSLDGHKAKVAVVLDYSGSMLSLYSRGDVQKVLSRLMPLALKFDDNGELDVWLFSNDFKRTDSMDINNYANYVNTVVKNARYSMGGTSYSPVLRDVMTKYFKEEKATSNVPTFVIFITDGENNDDINTTEVVRRSAEENIFIQFVGIGNERFEYLSKLDDLEGRSVDNTGFIRVNDMARIGEEELYSLLLDQYPDWLKEKK